MSELTLFKSRAPTMGYVFKSGKSVHFMEGRYATSAKDEIDELTTECNNAHPNFYIDNNEKVVDSELVDPMAVLVARIRAEERAKLIAATNPGRDMGETDQSGKLEGIANSSTITGLQQASNGVSVAPAPSGVTAGIKVGAASATKL